MEIAKRLGGLVVTAAASAVLLLLGVIYYMVTIWVIKMGARWAGYLDIDGGMVVLTAGIVTTASMIGSAIQK